MGFKGTGIVPAIHQPLKLQLLFQRSSDGASTSNQLFQFNYWVSITEEQLRS